MNGIDVDVSWHTLESGQGELWAFPNAVTRYMRDQYGGPALYRWCVTGPGNDEPQMIYIGEAVNLIRRVRNVLRPGKLKTAARLNAIFRGEVDRGNRVTIARAEFQDFSFNGVTFSTQDGSLYHKFKRCALENLFLCSYLGIGKRLLNLRTEPREYFMKRFVANCVSKSVAQDMANAIPENY